MLFECEACVGKESVVAFSFALSFCSSFFLFRWFWWFFLLGVDCHVVKCVGVRNDGRAEYVQWGTMLCVKGGWRVLVKISEVLLAEDTPPILIPSST